MWVVFLGRLAIMPSSLIAAAAGSSGVSWRRFVVADTAGGLLSLVALVVTGFALGETYEAAGGWFTAAGAVAVAALAVLLGRALRTPGDRRAEEPRPARLVAAWPP